MSKHSVDKHAIELRSWAIAALLVSGALMLLSLYRGSLTLLGEDAATARSDNTSNRMPNRAIVPPSPTPEPGERRYLNHEQWLAILEQEARVVAEDRPAQLAVLAGDSLSLWFPPDLLSAKFTWLNQGISGEATYGLLRRLKLFDATEPKTIFVMVGINDLIRGVPEETLLANHREIVRYLKAAHPQAQIVVQSILPHAADRALHSLTPPPWATQLAHTSNQTIRSLNQQLAAIAQEEGVLYLDLYPYFTDDRGEMQADLTTDGLHLSRQGYQVWQTRLQALQ